ncbi:hypothetical protein AEAC466_11190 [Asticcacaulis sp. AC466]|uniref:DUF4153 domain-containing protein n=1 Tax=Asticcacaulis sp. AC466 TaxID=1282362 RepID=UPI0003C3D0DC|nr:DUF4153 domain-containing protein [Asticcacaulis sp. AC466]ESQ83885.1 hypothetical protein AEAC466_11190 [Asticcacaulis sp. AC466]
MTNSGLNARETLIVRLGVGLVFGGILGWLIKQIEAHDSAPVLWQQVLASTLMLGAFVLWAGAGAMRRISLAVWGAAALAVIAVIAWNRAAHNTDASFNPFFFNLSFLIYPFLFISHELVSSADQAGKPVAPYPLYFDEAWKRGVQLILAMIFTGLFWGILWLGAALLGFIGFTWFKDLLANAYFAWPLSGLAIASAVNLGDVQTRLMSNFRSLVLGVLSWLLPVIAFIGVLFAVSLCFSGLEPLWKTKAATASLLTACVALVLLINAAYQQGDAERPVHIVLKVSSRIACGLTLVFAGLAAYSLYLRIEQYGLTPERAMAAVGVIIACLFGLAYTVAAVWRGRWLRGIELANIALAFVMAGLFLAVLTPIADPYRLSAEAQAARIDGGKITPAAFDWRVLRFETGTYGRDALKRLGQAGHTQAVRDAARTALALKDEDRWVLADAAKPSTHTPDVKQFVVSPKGTLLPADFLSQAYPAQDLPDCATASAAVPGCYAALIDLNHDNIPEVAILDGKAMSIFLKDSQANNQWRLMSNVYLTPTDAEAFRKGQALAQRPIFDDLKIGDKIIDIRDSHRNTKTGEDLVSY